MPTSSHDEDARQLSDLIAPLGEPDSGKVRYAAAMYFHKRGWLSSSALEFYRSLAKDDASDPLHLLSMAGLSAEVDTVRQRAMQTRDC
jgi:hypothetical protein